MNAQTFGGNPYDNQDFLAEQFRKLTPEQQVTAFLAVSEKYHREKCSREELAQTVERINKQHERALNRIGALEKELRARNDPDEIDEAA